MPTLGPRMQRRPNTATIVRLLLCQLAAVRVPCTQAASATPAVSALAAPARATAPPASARATAPPAQPSCAARLVFYVGLQKEGTTSFQHAMAALGYEAIKVFIGDTKRYQYAHADLQAFIASDTGRLANVFATAYDRARLWPLAVSDFPVFGVPCQLARAYPNASFVAFTRNFSDWFKSERADVLCQWMLRRSTLAQTAQWSNGLEFMRLYWGDAFDKFWKRRTMLCADVAHPAWTPIKRGFSRRFDQQRAEVSRCLAGTGRLFTRPLHARPEIDHGLPAHLGCSAEAQQRFHLPVANVRKW